MTESDDRCGKQATVRYQWGSDQAHKYACKEHTSGLMKICNHMGWGFPHVKLAPDTTEICGSLVDDESL